MKQFFMVVAFAVVFGTAAQAAIPRDNRSGVGQGIGSISPEDGAELARMQEDLAIALGNQGNVDASERVRLAQCFGWRNCPPAGSHFAPGFHPGFGPAPVVRPGHGYIPPGVIYAPGVVVVPVVPVVPVAPVSNICVSANGHAEPLHVFLRVGAACHVNYPDGTLKYNGYIQ